MIIYPAVDISKGKCVRLYQGRADRETVFSDDPVEVAQRWIGEGASYVHVVDLDGAFCGSPQNLSTVERIASLGVPIQLGGGIREEENISAAFGSGCWRVILGTRAVLEPDWFEDMSSKYRGKLAVSIDARGAMAAVKGWVEKSQISVEEVMKRLAAAKPAAFIYTDISRDGTLEGPNVPGVRRILERASAPLIVAGGIASLNDIRVLASLQLHGVIIGKALYTGDIVLADAIRAGAGPSST